MQMQQSETWLENGSSGKENNSVQKQPNVIPKPEAASTTANNSTTALTTTAKTTQPAQVAPNAVSNTAMRGRMAYIFHNGLTEHYLRFDPVAKKYFIERKVTHLRVTPVFFADYGSLYHDAARQLHQIESTNNGPNSVLEKQLKNSADGVVQGNSASTTGPKKTMPNVQEIPIKKTYQQIVSEMSAEKATRNTNLTANLGQNKPFPKPKLSTFQTFRDIIRSEGFGSLYAPLPPTLLMAVPQNVVYFVTYEGVRDYLNGGPPNSANIGAKNNNSSTRSKYAESRPPPTFGWATPMVAGALARTVAVLVSAPFEVVRTQLGAKNAEPFLNLVQNFHKEHGARGFFSGLVPTMFRDVPFSASYWYFFESLRNNKNLWGESGKEKCLGLKNNDVYSTFTMGVISGTLATFLTHPFDVVKTQKQVTMDNFPKFETAGHGAAAGSGSSFQQKTGSTNYSSTTLSQNNSGFTSMLFRSFKDGSAFAGIVPRLLRVAPACGIMISSYEWAKKL